MNYEPNYWQVIKIVRDKETIYKLFGTWYGGYTSGDSWRLNSGIMKVEKEGHFLYFYGFSGSFYTVVNSENLYRTTSYSQSILNNMIENSMKAGVSIEILPFKTEWESLNYV